MQSIVTHPGLTVALALVLGIVSQSVAHHLRIPGIVVLLATGVVFGPDGAGWIQPQGLGSALGILTGFAVAVILFEGGMSLKFQKLRREQRSIRQLVLLGGWITMLCGMVAARLIMQWPWQTALLFGTLVMVTGPTVINPLLKRLKVKRGVATVLEAEGVLIDALGAVVAVVALEAVLSPAGRGWPTWIWHIVFRLGFGAFCGVVAGLFVVGVFRMRRILPEGIENVFTLCIVLALFQGTNAILSESGIAAVTVAGILVGNSTTHALQDLAEFKEELTVMLIGMLFVLLSSDIRLSQVQQLGWSGIATAAALMIFVRPLAVWLSTMGANMAWRERLFIAWIGPRGIVAAAVASLFAVSLNEHNIPGGYELRALVFLVITVTVACAGLTGGWVAGLLGLRRPSQNGWVIMGANELARALAKLLREDGQETVLIDSNPDNCRAAEKDCTRVIFGNAIQSRSLQRAEIDTRIGVMALTPNDEVNFLFIQKVKQEARGVELYSALKINNDTLSPSMLHPLGAQVAFLNPMDVELWCTRIRRSQVRLQRWFVGESTELVMGKKDSPAGLLDSGVLLLCLHGGKRVTPVGDLGPPKPGDEVSLLIHIPEVALLATHLTTAGWKLMDPGADNPLLTSQCHLP
ncbi:MAG: cation:proton antiporter [Thermodesulfobacteriota bacterium]